MTKFKVGDTVVFRGCSSSSNGCQECVNREGNSNCKQGIIDSEGFVHGVVLEFEGRDDQYIKLKLIGGNILRIKKERIARKSLIEPPESLMDLM